MSRNWVYTITLLLFSVSMSLSAIEYSPPNDGNWYLLQKPDNFDEVCSTSIAPCDLAKGTYLLTNFGTNPPTKSLITLPLAGTVGGETNPLGLVFVEEECVGQRSSLIQCIATCPEGSVLVGVTSCYAYDVPAPPSDTTGRLIRHVPAIFERRDSRSISCRVPSGSFQGFGQLDNSIKVGGSCAPF